MFREKIPSRQLCAWLFAGMVPVLIQLLGGDAWIWITILGTVSVLLTLLVWRTLWEPPKWLFPFLFIYIVLLLSQLLGSVSAIWPSGEREPWVGLILLAVAAFSAQKGISAAARVGTVLFWTVLILYLTVFVAGTKEVNLPWLAPRWHLPDEMGLSVLLVPLMSVCLLKADGQKGTRLFLVPLFIVAAALLTTGILSPAVAINTPNAFFEMSRSINLFGIVRRFEAMICAGMTVGWFALMSLLLSVCSVLINKFLPLQSRVGVWVVAIGAAGLQLCGLHIRPSVLLIVGAVFWVGIPLLTQGLEKIKKS